LLERRELDHHHAPGLRRALHRDHLAAAHDEAPSELRDDARRVAHVLAIAIPIGDVDARD
jgi:hypothetical protein